MNKMVSPLAWRYLALYGAFALNAVPLTAYSQDSASARSPVALEEVVVTARKRSQNLQDVALSVAAIDGEKISDAGLTNLQDFTAYIPNFSQTKTPLFNVMSIRGIGSGPNPGFEQSVGMYNDGVYWGRGRQSQAPLFDLARIEVLKGPQNILFGKSSIAGAVSIISAAPTQFLEGYVRALGGEHGERKYEAAVSGPITDSLSARLALHQQEFDGWVYNEFIGDDQPGSETKGIRLILDYSPSDIISARLKWEDSSLEVQGANYELIQITDMFIAPPAARPIQLIGLSEGVDYRSAYGNSGNFPGTPVPTQSNDQENVALNIDIELGEHILTMVSGYSEYLYSPDGDLDFTPSSIIGARGDESFEQVSQEIRIASPAGNEFEYIGGVFFQNADLDIKNDIWLQLSEAGIFPDTKELDGIRGSAFVQKTKTYSAFFQGTWMVTDVFRATLGLRYNKEEKDLFKQATVSDYSGQVIPAADLSPLWETQLNTVPFDTTRDRSEEDWSPAITLEYDANEDTLLYATLTRGYKGGGYDNNLGNGNNIGNSSDVPGEPDDPDKLEYEKEQATSFELGAKMTLLDGAATLNLAAFHTEYEDLQVSIFDSVASFNVQNAAGATSEGIEVEGRLMLSESLMIAGNLAYLDFEYEDFRDGQCTTAMLADHHERALAGEFDDDPAVDAFHGCKQDMTGKTSNYSPEWSGAFTIQHRATMGELQLVSTLDMNYQGAYFFAADLDPVLEQDATTKFNLRIALGDIEDSWQIALIGKNLTDELTLSHGEDVPFGNGNLPSYSTVDYVGTYFGVVDRPKSWAVEGVYRF